jgi:hypothetical protein
MPHTELLAVGKAQAFQLLRWKASLSHSRLSPGKEKMASFNSTAEAGLHSPRHAKRWRHTHPQNETTVCWGFEGTLKPLHAHTEIALVKLGQAQEVFGQKRVSIARVIDTRLEHNNKSFLPLFPVLWAEDRTSPKQMSVSPPGTTPEAHKRPAP